MIPSVMQSKAVEDLIKYVDIKGMVVQKDGDGGDSAYRTALTSVLCFVVGRFIASIIYKDNLVSNCHLGNGQWRRHQDTTEWYADPKTFSADQAAKVILCLLVTGERKLVYKWLWAMLKRGMFHQNTRRNDDRSKHWKLPDIIRPGEVANLIRGLNLWPLYPLLAIIDIKFILDLYFRKKTPWDYDSLMAIDLIYSRVVMPTPFSELAVRLYTKTDYKFRIMYNYADANNGIAPLGELYILACEKVLEKSSSN